MTAVTQLGGGPQFRFARQLVQGDALLIEFTIQGYASLVSHTWRGQLRGRANKLYGTFGVSLTLVTVSTANDSLHVAMAINQATTRLLKAGTYVAQCEDVTTGDTWASGTIRVLKDRSF